MANRTHSPRPIGSVSAISDTNVHNQDHPRGKSRFQHSHSPPLTHPDHNPLHHALHSLKNSFTLESSSDETRRESLSSDHAHVNDHGGKEAEKQFWEKHRTHDEVGKGNREVGDVKRRNSLKKRLENAEGYGRVHEWVDRIRPGNEVAREGGSMVG